MIPVLYDKHYLVNHPYIYDYSFRASQLETDGYGALVDCDSCTVREERNGEYELKLKYLPFGKNFEYIEAGCVVLAVPAPHKDPQPFRIHTVTKNLNGSIDVEANHISYDLLYEVCGAFSAVGVQQAMTQLKNSIIYTYGGTSFSTKKTLFNFWTDKTDDTLYAVPASDPWPARKVLLGTEGSILDVYGGEYEFDKNTVKLHEARGKNRGVVVEYGKNLTSFTSETSYQNVYDVVIPWLKYEVEEQEWHYIADPVTAADVGITSATPLYWATKALDCSEKIKDPQKKTEAQLETALRNLGIKWLKQNKAGQMKQNLNVNLILLSDTEQFKSISNLEEVNLCDTVTIRHGKFGITATAKVIETEYDALNERYKKVVIGTAKQKFASTISLIKNREA